MGKLLDLAEVEVEVEVEEGVNGPSHARCPGPNIQQTPHGENEDQDMEDDEEEEEVVSEESSDKVKTEEEESLVGMLDCSICLRRLSSFHTCENMEHTACRSCAYLTSKCSICNTPAIFSRCRLLEKIVESLCEPCKNMIYGEPCRETVHSFVPCSCPIEGCNFIGSPLQLSVHLRSQHPDSLASFLFNQFYSISLRSDDHTICILREMDGGDLFLLNNVQHDIGNMVSVNYIGNEFNYVSSPFSVDLEAKNYLLLHSGQVQPSLKFTSKIESIRSPLLNQHPTVDTGFLLVPSGFFHGDKLKLLFRITPSTTVDKMPSFV